MPLPAKVRLASGQYETQEINTCSTVSVEIQRASPTLAAALFITAKLCVGPMNAELQDESFPFQRLLKSTDSCQDNVTETCPPFGLWNDSALERFLKSRRFRAVELK